MQGSLFGDHDKPIVKATAAPADVQLSLFRPNALDVRAPKRRGGREATPAEVRPDLHTDTLTGGE